MSLTKVGAARQLALRMGCGGKEGKEERRRGEERASP